MGQMAKYMRDGRAPIPESETVSRVMSSIKGKNTKPEITLRKLLFHNGMSGYRINCRKIPGCPDICFLRRKIVVFVHGCFWHRCPHCELPLPKTHTKYWREKFDKNVKRDKRTLRKLKATGWDVVVLWECQIKEDPIKCLRKVQEVHRAKEV